MKNQNYKISRRKTQEKNLYELELDKELSDEITKARYIKEKLGKL